MHKTVLLEKIVVILIFGDLARLMPLVAINFDSNASLTTAQGKVNSAVTTVDIDKWVLHIDILPPFRAEDVTEQLDEALFCSTVTSAV